MAEPQRYTDEELSAFAANRLSEDPHPDLIEAWPNEAARLRAELQATGVELYTDEGARVAPGQGSR